MGNITKTSVMASTNARRTTASYWLGRRFSAAFSSLPPQKRALIVFEPMWAIPFGLVSVYASLYQEKMGLTPVNIGLLSSITLGMYTLSSLYGGIIVDRLGRMRALLIHDLINWTIPTLIWAIAQDFRYFLVAALLNGLGGVAEIAFSCLLVEDTTPQERLSVFSWIQFVDLLSGLFVPLAGVLVGMWGVVQATKGLYWLAFFSMTFMFLLRNMYIRETSVGLARMAETAGTSPWETLRSMKEALSLMVKDKSILSMFVVSVITRIRYSVLSVYLALFLTRAVGLAPSIVSVFPTVSSIMIFIITVGVIPAVGYARAKLKLAFGLFGAALGVLVVGISSTLPGGMWVALGGGVLLGGATGLINPYQATVWHNSLPDDKRSQILSVTAVARTLLVTPSGYIAGLIFQARPIYLMLCLCALLCCGALILVATGGHKEA